MTGDRDPKMWVADLLTLSNGVFGFLSILTWSSELGPFREISNALVAAAYIGLGLVADGVDGIVARAWGSTGLGDALDSINDAITFSVAPAVFLLETYESTGGLPFRTAVSLAAVGFVLAGMLRLARHQNGGSATVFRGLPTPWSAAALVALLLLGVPGWGAIGVTVVLGGLNLSTVPYPKTRGAFKRTATLVLAAATIVVSGLVVLLGPDRAPVAAAATVIAFGLIVFAPLFAR